MPCYPCTLGQPADHRIGPPPTRLTDNQPPPRPTKGPTRARGTRQNPADRARAPHPQPKINIENNNPIRSGHHVNSTKHPG